MTLVLMMTLSGCSTLRLGYNSADQLLAFQIDRYFDLDDRQQDLQREHLRELLVWHRETQLTDYADLLGEWQTTLRAGRAVSADEVAQWQQALTRRLQVLGERSAPALADLALTLRPAQLRRLQTRMDEGNADFRKQRIQGNEADIRQRRVDDWTQRFEDWMGRLTPAQKQRLRELMEQRPLVYATVLEERRARQRDFMNLLERIRTEQPPREQAAAWVRAYFAGLSEPSRHPDRLPVLTAYRRANQDMIAQIASMSTPAQRQAAGKRLQGLRDDFMALASAAAPVQAATGTEPAPRLR